MRNVTRLLGVVGIAALVLAVATPASAGCIPNKFAGTFSSEAGYAYWLAPGSNPDSLKGRFWQLGNRAAGNEGACTVATCGGTGGWLYFTAAGLNMNAALGNGDVAGCPAGTLITVAEVASADGRGSFFLAGTVNEVSGPSVDFDYTPLGNQTFVPVPRPRVLSSSRAGATVNVQVALDAAPGAFGPAASSAITGYRLVTASGTADPGRAAAYSTLQSVGAAGGTVSQAVDCSNINADQFLGVQVLFADGVVSQYTGPTTRINCNPGLADPTKVKPVVPKGPKTKTNLNPNE